MKPLCAALAVAVLLLGCLYYGANSKLATTQANLEVALEINQTNREAIARLERSISNTDKVLAGWNEDRTTLANVRSATRQAIKEAMKDANFKAWASGAVPADAWRLLREAPDQNGNGSSAPSGGAAGGLPGNADSGKRQ